MQQQPAATKQNSYSSPSKRELRIAQSKSIGRHYKKLAQDILNKHKKSIDENVEDIKAKIQASKSVVLVDYKGLTVAEDTVIKQILKNGGKLA